MIFFIFYFVDTVIILLAAILVDISEWGNNLMTEHMRCLARGLIYCKDKGQRKNYQLTRIEPPHIYFLSFHKCERRAPSAERDDKGLYEPAGEC